MRIPSLLAIILFACSTWAQAERSQDFGDYVVHYNAIQTALLSPEVASHYNIQRSRNRALLNIVVQRKELGAPVEPVTARVEAEAYNMVRQLREIEVREVKEPNAIYYIGEFFVRDQDTLSFTLDIRPQGSNRELEVKFRQQFFVD